LDGSLGCGGGIIARRIINSLFFGYKDLTTVRDELPGRSRAIRIIRAVIRSIRVSQSEEAHHAGAHAPPRRGGYGHHGPAGQLATTTDASGK